MGCGSSNATVPIEGDQNTEPKGPYREYFNNNNWQTISQFNYFSFLAPSESFEIPLEENNNPDNSLIKKHPPKRLIRLETQTNLTPTLEELEEKLATAETRRNQFLASRSNKAVQESEDNEMYTTTPKINDCLNEINNDKTDGLAKITKPTDDIRKIEQSH